MPSMSRLRVQAIASGSTPNSCPITSRADHHGRPSGENWNATSGEIPRAIDTKFLGFSFWIAKGRIVRRRVAPQAIKRLKERVRELTRRSAGRSLAQMCKPLGKYLAGWKAYFRLADTPRVFADIDGWTRHRLRAVQLKHWKRGKVIYRELVARGMAPDAPRRVATNGRRSWRNSAK